ncbi:MAG: prefoldin subunit alpha [Thermoplasmata archaeon]|nr:prefoldin subunit alpha [Thermoplasmata archaeon]
MNEDELQKGIATLELLKVQLENLQKQIDAIQLSIQEIIRAVETLKGYTKMENDEILVPIGAGVFISAKIGEKKGIMSIGNNIFVDLPLEKMIESLKERRKKYEELLSKLTIDMKKLQENYAVLSDKVEKDYQKYLEEMKNVQSP